MGNIEINNWLVTGRPFVRQPSDYSLDELKQITEAQGSWGKAAFALGFSSQEIDGWRTNGDEILEVGPGKGYAFYQLRDMGIQVKALEPTLNGPETLDDVQKVKRIYAGMESDVKAFKAVDAHLAFGVNRFTIAFATGPNFHNFSSTLKEVKGGIKALISTLKPEPSTYLTFEINSDGSIRYSCHIAYQKSRKFQLTKYLQDKNILYNIVDHFDGMFTNAKAIRIYRLSPDGTDSLGLFN